MAIIETLEAHTRKGGVRDRRTHCICGWKSQDGELGGKYHLAHVGEVLEQHMREREEQLRQLVQDMVDPDPCAFDHRGGCQAHGYLILKPGEKCPHAEAKELLEGDPHMDANDKSEATCHVGEYTPDTKEVRGAWLQAHRTEAWGGRMEIEARPKERLAEFDRWLDQVKAEAKAEALQEAAQAYPTMLRDMVSRGSVATWLLDRAEEIKQEG